MSAADIVDRAAADGRGVGGFNLLRFEYTEAHVGALSPRLVANVVADS